MITKENHQRYPMVKDKLTELPIESIPLPGRAVGRGGSSASVLERGQGCRAVCDPGPFFFDGLTTGLGAGNQKNSEELGPDFFLGFLQGFFSC